jgi:hypothetical protein
MQKINTSINSLKRLFVALEPEFIAKLIAIIWKVVAAVHAFFHRRCHAGEYRQVRETTGTTLS